MDSKTEFTQLLFELTKKQNLSLVESLEIMSKFQKKGAVEFAAKHILECLNQGLSFSGALKTCKEIEFDDLYISFVSFAEKTGHFGETCEFLYFRCKRKHENFVQVFEACLYPVFVVLLSIAATSFLMIFGKSNNVFGDIGFSMEQSEKIISSCFRGCVFLFCFFSISFFVLKNILSDNKMFESFLAADFLVRSGINLIDTFDALVSVAGIDSSLGQEFLKIKNKILQGTEFSMAFMGLNKKLERFFYLAQHTGGECDVFGKMAAFLKEFDEKRRKICFTLIEPIFICGTGVFLIILLSGIYVPFV